MGPLIRDLRFAARSLGRHVLVPGLAILALTLGIGANSAVFSVVEASLLRPLPLPDAERVALLFERRTATGEESMVSPAVFGAWEQRCTAFDELSPVGYNYYTVTGVGDPQVILGARVDGDFFDVMGVEAQLGRRLTAADDRPEAPPVVVLRHSFWQTRFGGDPAVLGRTLRLDGRQYQVVGVLPATYVYPARADLWLPARFDAEESAIRWRYLMVAGRLRPGATLAEAQAEAAGVVEGLAADHPEAHRGWSASVRPLHEVLSGDSRAALFVLLAAVALVLLIACANVAGLLLVRSLSRRREIALRASVGATRGRLFRLVLVEGLLLGASGGALGLLLATPASQLLVRLLGSAVPSYARVAVDPAVLAVTAVLALLSSLLFGTAPALRSARLDLVSALKSREAAARGGLRPLRALVVAEVALTMLVLVAAGLLTRSFLNLRAIDPGFDAAGVLAVPLSLPPDASRYPDAAARLAFFHQAGERLAALPGVETIGGVDAAPFIWPANVSAFTVAGQPEPPTEERPSANVRAVLGDYFRALRVPLLAGRLPGPADRAGAAPVAVVDRALAEAQWPDGHALGGRLRIGEVELEVVGVVGSVRQRRLTGEEPPTIYLPFAQSPGGSATLMLRTAGDAAALAAGVRRAIWRLDPDLPLDGLEPLDARLREQGAEPRAMALLVGLFGLLALLLAALGIYGVVSYASLQRVPEIGLRLAVGARPPQVLRMLGAEVFGLVALGVAVGWGVALLAGRGLQSMLVGIRSGDPLVHLATALLLAVVALAASYLPARRAAHTAPRAALVAD